ncbi:MAG: hypothetical protein DRJ13_11770 [Bacteroidetes bacterium]|nr:MAG: hypothetical protein DRJ13_11770 [Bacteroidota bacterium]
MRKILSLLKSIWVFNFLRRLYFASRYFNKKYLEIFKWGLTSKEDTNFTYHLTQDNIAYLAHTIAVVTKLNYSQIIEYIEEVHSDDTLRGTILSAIENSREKRFADKKFLLSIGILEQELGYHLKKMNRNQSRT